MERDKFDTMTLPEVAEKAKADPASQPGKPKYFDRPWTQLHDEMLTAGATTVGELPSDRGDVFFHSTKSVYGKIDGLLGLFRRSN